MKKYSQDEQRDIFLSVPLNVYKEDVIDIT